MCFIALLFGLWQENVFAGFFMLWIFLFFYGVFYIDGATITFHYKTDNPPKH